MAALPGRAQAQTATVTAANGQSCAGTRFGSNLNCTSNDFSSNLTFDQPSASALASCIAGSTVSIDVLASITSGSAVRFDGAYFFGENANSPSLNNAADQCSVGLFPTAPDPPFFQSPVTLPNVNVCGDYRASQSSVLRMNGVKVKCSPTPGTNSLAIPYTLVFSNSNAANCNIGTVTAGTTAKCLSSSVSTVTGVAISGYVKVTKQTNPNNHVQAFGFTASTSSPTGISATSFSIADNQSQTLTVPFNSTGSSFTVTVTEAAVGGWYPDTSIVCLTPSGASASSYVTFNNATRTLTATLSTTNFGADCTFTNTKIPTFKLKKKTLGGTGTFAFTTGNLASTPGPITITAMNTSTPASPTAINVTAANTAITVAETAVAGYRATSATCTDAQSALTGNTGSGWYSLPASSSATPFPVLTINAAAVNGGEDFECEITNSKVPTVQVTKVTVGNSSPAGPFSFSTSTNLVTTPSLTTSGSGPGGAATSSETQVASIGTTVGITETALAGYALASATCTDGAGTVGSLTGSTYTIPNTAVVPGAAFNCTFTNNKNATVKVQKRTTIGTGTFSFAATNLANPVSNIAVAAVNTNTPAAPAANTISVLGTLVTITEGVTAGFSLLAAYCADANAAVTGNTGSLGTLTGNTLSIASTLVKPGSDFTCLFTNSTAAPSATLNILKSASTAGPVGIGDTITYAYDVTNTGNVPITNVQISDTANGFGSAPAPSSESLQLDIAPAGDSSDTVAANGQWTTLGPGDKVRFSWTYTVVQSDIDFRQ